MGEARQAVLRLIRAHWFPSASYSPSFLRTESKHLRGSPGPDKGDRRSWGFERNDPGRIRQALNRSASGQVAHGRSERVLIWPARGPGVSRWP